MDHSKDEKLRDDVEQNCDRNEVAHGCQRTAHQSPAFALMKNQIAQEWRSSRAGVLEAVACSEHGGGYGLEDESESARSVEARNDVLQKTVRQYVQFASVDKFPDRKGDRGNKRHYYKCRENRGAGER